jgi:hypothetical protein
MANLTTAPVPTPDAWQATTTHYEEPLPRLIASCLHVDPKRRPSCHEAVQAYEEHFNSSYELLISEGKREDLYEWQNRGQLMGDNRSSRYFSEVKGGSRFSDALNRPDPRQPRVDTTNESFDQRL